MKSFLALLFPKWKTISRDVVVVFRGTYLCRGLKLTEDCILEIQQNRIGRKRAFIVNAYGKSKIDYNYVMGLLS